MALLPANLVTASFDSLSLLNRLASIDETEWDAFMLTIDQEELRVGIDWDEYSRDSIDVEAMIASPIEGPKTVKVSLDGCPWLADTCAAVHISSAREDFLTLHPILNLKAVKGVGGTIVYAKGIGSVKLKVTRGLVLELENVLFIPNTTARLISIGRLLNSLNYDAWFSPSGLKICNSASAVIATGSIIPNKFIYKLNCSEVSVYTLSPLLAYPLLKPCTVAWAMLAYLL